MDLNHYIILYMCTIKIWNRKLRYWREEEKNLLIIKTLNLYLSFLSTNTKLKTLVYFVLSKRFQRFGLFPATKF